MKTIHTTQEIKEEKQPEYTETEVEEKIKRYGKIRNRLFALGIAGGITLLSSPFIFSNYGQPETIKTYQNAQTTIQELQNRRKNLSDKLKSFSYQTHKVKELEKMINSRYNETLVGINEAIESVEKDIPNMEINPEVIQYQENKRARKKQFVGLYFGGMLSMILGGFGGIIFDRKKDNLKRKTKNENSN